MAYYNRVEVDDDDDLNIVYKTEKILPAHHAIQLYVETEYVSAGDAVSEQTGAQQGYISPYHWGVAPHMPYTDILATLPPGHLGAAELGGSTQPAWTSLFQVHNDNQCYNVAGPSLFTGMAGPSHISDVAGPSNAPQSLYNETAYSTPPTHYTEAGPSTHFHDTPVSTPPTHYTEAGPSTHFHDTPVSTPPTHYSQAGPSTHFHDTPIVSSSEEDDPEAFPYDEDDDEPVDVGVPVEVNVHPPSSSARPLPLDALPMIDLNEMLVGEGDLQRGMRQWGDEATLEKGFIFKTRDEVVAAVKRYSVKHNRAYRVKDSNNAKWVAACRQRDGGCQWKIRAFFKASTNHWEITSFQGPHTCMGETLMMDHPHLDSRLMAADIEEMVMEDASVKIAVLQAHIQSKYSYHPSYKKTWMAKDKAIQNLYGRWDESYNRLPFYLNALRDKNHGTIVGDAVREELVRRMAPKTHEWARRRRRRRRRRKRKGVEEKEDDKREREDVTPFRRSIAHGSDVARVSQSHRTEIEPKHK